MSDEDTPLNPRERMAYDALRDAAPAGYMSTREHAEKARDLVARLERSALVDGAIAALYEERDGARWHPDDDARHDDLLADATRIADRFISNWRAST